MAKTSILEIVKSKEYLEASKKSGDWKKRIPLSDSRELANIEKEKTAFFSTMQVANPELYALFRIDDKALSEAIIRKRTGKEAILD